MRPPSACPTETSRSWSTRRRDGSTRLFLHFFRAFCAFKVNGAASAPSMSTMAPQQARPGRSPLRSSCATSLRAVSSSTRKETRERLLIFSVVGWRGRLGQDAPPLLEFHPPHRLRVAVLLLRLSPLARNRLHHSHTRVAQAAAAGLDAGRKRSPDRGRARAEDAGC